MRTRFILRFDDICPTMNWPNWQPFADPPADCLSPFYPSSFDSYKSDLTLRLHPYYKMYSSSSAVS